MRLEKFESDSGRVGTSNWEWEREGGFNLPWKIYNIYSAYSSEIAFTDDENFFIYIHPKCPVE